MKISYNWLKEFLPDLTATPEEVAQTLTAHAYETLVVGRWNIDKGIVAVKITKIEPHPNADRLRLVTVTNGEKEIRVVCGAPNIEEGQVVPYAPPGTKVVGQDGQPFEIKAAAIRGEMSPGMINSARELGLSEDHGGIFILPPDTPLGTKLTDHIPNDTILEVEMTPNRAHDSLSHLGIARELAALLKLKIIEPQLADLPAPQPEVSGYTLNIQSADKTPRYMGIVLEGAVNTGISPLWLTSRLFAVGAKPISPLVDITNYVLFETGNPSHVFDTAKLPGKDIGVRLGQKGDQLTLLDETTIEPHPDDLVITSGAKPVALAGVMGGLDTAVASGTSEIFLEIANFLGFPIQETARRTAIRTESSYRFSKGIDPNLAGYAAGRLIKLITELTGAKAVGVLDEYPHKRIPPTIEFRPERITSVAGIKVDSDEVKDVLTRLRFQVDDTSKIWNITAPEGRLDIEGEHDIVEEVVRLIGLDQIPSKTTAELQKELAPNSYSLEPGIYWRESIRDLLVQLGFTETINSAFEHAKYAAMLDIDRCEHISVTNPSAPELANMRVSLLPGLLQNAAANRQDFHKKFTKQEKAMFEIGNVYLPESVIPGSDPGSGRVPGVCEELHLAGILVGDKQAALNVIENIRQLLDVESLSPPSVGGDQEGVVIYLDTVSPDILKKLKYRVPLTVFELDLNQMISHAPENPPVSISTLEAIKNRPAATTQFSDFSRYPSVLRDISFLVDPSVSADTAQELIERTGKELVIDTDLFDEFQPSPEATAGAVRLPRKSLSFHIEYQSKARTLTDEEVNKVHAKIIKALESDLSAEIR